MKNILIPVLAVVIVGLAAFIFVVRQRSTTPQQQTQTTSSNSDVDSTVSDIDNQTKNLNPDTDFADFGAVE